MASERPEGEFDPADTGAAIPQHRDEDLLQQRVAYLEATVAAMAADLTHMRTLAPQLFRQHKAQAMAAAAPPPTVLARVEAVPVPRRKSLESEFGSRVLSKIAIVLLLFGAAWFLKWAFDNRWIGPTGRVLIGLMAGVAVVVWSERFRRQGVAAFSYALKAVGSGVLYLSLWAAFQLYHLLPSPVALLLMIAVTAWNTYMAWAQDAELLAGYALLGGYLTPALLSTGGDHEIFLFTYLLAIAAAVVALLRTKPWSRLLLGALPATTAYFIAWYTVHFRAENAGLTLGFALLLWAVFAAVPLVALEDGALAGVLSPLASAAFGALTVYSVLADSGGKAQEPWWAVGFAAVYLLLMRARPQRIASAIHLSLGVVFLTVAIPLKATGRGITVGWLAEAVALLWVASLPSAEGESARRSRTVLRWLAYASLAMGVVGALAGPWIFNSPQEPFLNRNFATSLGAIGALAAAIVIGNRARAAQGESAPPVLKAIVLVAIHAVLLAAMYREIDAVAFRGVTGDAWHAASERAGFLYSGWMMLQGAASLILGFVRRNPLSRWIGLVLLGLTVLKAFLYDMRDLGTGYRVISYLALGVILMAVSFAYQKDWLSLREAIAVEPAAESAADKGQ